MRAVLIGVCLILCLGFALSAPAASTPKPQFDVSCDVCLAGVYLVNRLISLNYTEAEMEKPFIDFCHEFVFQKSEHPMCPGLIRAYAPSVIYVLTRTLLSPHEVCDYFRVRVSCLGLGAIRNSDVHADSTTVL
jgi:hypothetical protein